MKLTNEFIEKFLADFHYELTRDQLEQDWVFDKKPFYKEKNAWCFRTPDKKCWIEIDAHDVESAFVGGVDFESLRGNNDEELEALCNKIQKWVSQEIAPLIEDWAVKEFSPEIEKWVKEYMNDKRTPLHISDFCADDSGDKGEQCDACKKEPIMKMGTVEPEWNDEKHLITKAGSIQDFALAFIYGAIKKYGQNPGYFDELKDYIIQEAEYIGKK